ncbi:hypothetical protein M9H77_17013 [Catharanthus roseus]|uniref:Uncharacterized protein n=1 Tax=Catharanthus roseus TaxID=4058 RepID=A0ACC0B3D9_CATRO|nr:hypothetical protein M9H77_17013 [Catharanthus roseus]
MNFVKLEISSKRTEFFREKEHDCYNKSLVFLWPFLSFLGVSFSMTELLAWVFYFLPSFVLLEGNQQISVGVFLDEEDGEYKLKPPKSGRELKLSTPRKMT